MNIFTLPQTAGAPDLLSGLLSAVIKEDWGVEPGHHRQKTSAYAYNHTHESDHTISRNEESERLVYIATSQRPRHLRGYRMHVVNE